MWFCATQVRTADLLVHDAEYTRSHVQKSCTLLSREPCFGSAPSALLQSAETARNRTPLLSTHASTRAPPRSKQAGDRSKAEEGGGNRGWGGKG